jgi:hypothetical protein
MSESSQQARERSHYIHADGSIQAFVVRLQKFVVIEHNKRRYRVAFDCKTV